MRMVEWWKIALSEFIISVHLHWIQLYHSVKVTVIHIKNPFMPKSLNVMGS